MSISHQSLVISKFGHGNAVSLPKTIVSIRGGRCNYHPINCRETALPCPDSSTTHAPTAVGNINSDATGFDIVSHSLLVISKVRSAHPTN